LSIDPTYGAEVALLVNAMKQKPEGVPLRYPEIEELINIKRDNPLFHKLITAAIRKLNAQRLPTIKVRNARKANISGGLVRVSPNEVPQIAYDKQARGHARVADNAIAALKTVDISTLSEEEQVLMHAVHSTAMMAQLMVTEDTQDRLKNAIRSGGKLDGRALAKLLEHNL
jgi:hypothetical protein